MFFVSVEAKFTASHYLVLPDGSKEAEHEHNWEVTAEVSSDKLDDIGIIIDFNKLKAMLNNVLATLNGKKLKEIKYFEETFQSAEKVAQYIYEKLDAELAGNVKLDSVKVFERPGFCAKFSR
ncbi:MAG: 6-pyruvoyl trahydropterin synthase family protein [Planctomycetota bacterium]